MTLDGFTVSLGDNIYDILLQLAGTVTNVSVGTFRVDFGAGRNLQYVGNGLVAGVRRAYWGNPVLTLPRKADQQWAMLQAVVNTIRAFPCP